MIHFTSDVASGYSGLPYGRGLAGADGAIAESRNPSTAPGNEGAIREGTPSPGKNNAVRSPEEEKERKGIKDPRTEREEEEEKKRKGIKDPNDECETCKNRKYKDGSDEMVSFKTPTKISPESAASAVRAHEQEHVSNAYAKAAARNGKVIAASVSIHTAICPECGRTYVSGGTTHTQIKYYNEDNPYQKSLKSADRSKYSGMHLNYSL